MELADVLARGGAGRVIVIDDFYARPSLAVVDDEAYTNLFHHLTADAAARDAVRAAVGLAASEPLDAIMNRVEAELETLWDRYADGSLTAALMPLFAPVEGARAGSKLALEVIEKYSRDFLHTEPVTFGSLDDAKDALSDCTLAFVDFRFQDHATAAQTIQIHEQFAPSYRGRLVFEGERCPKIVYLISSSMPATDRLEAFRQATGLRAAFFKPLRKSEVSAEVLATEMARWHTRFSALGKLDAYLSAMTDAVRSSSDRLCKQVDEIELHDLAILSLFRLAIEHESLQSYLTWLVSEAMASKLRLAPQLQTELVPEAGLPPLDGKLKLGATLFELFSQIAIVPVEPGAAKPAFGDVYRFVPPAAPAAAAPVAVAAPASEAPAADAAPAADGAPAAEAAAEAPAAPVATPEDAANKRKLLLVISPACDLVRCKPDDMVLCIEGTEQEAKPDMEELLKAGVLFGKGSHVIQHGEGDTKKYAYINWNAGAFRTIPVRELTNAGLHQRVARLSEMFAQEVKELALSNASRVGIQVNPPFAVSARVVVRCKFANVTHEADLSAMEFSSALVIRGRTRLKSDSDTILGFTEQFADWVRGTFLPAMRAKLQNGAQAGQLDVAERWFSEWRDYQVDMGASKKQSYNNIAFKVVTDVDNIEASNNSLEVLVVAPGAV